MNIDDGILGLYRAAGEIVLGLSRLSNLSRVEQGEALRECSAALIEMRRQADQLALQCRRAS